MWNIMINVWLILQRSDTISSLSLAKEYDSKKKWQFGCELHKNFPG